MIARKPPFKNAASAFRFSEENPEFHISALSMDQLP
jgi:hypothetical protein